MSLINSISRYIYGFSIVEYTVFILFTTWAYLKIKDYISKNSARLWNIINIFLIIVFALFVLYKVVFSREIGSVVAKVDFIPFSSYFEYFKGENSEAFLTNRANILLFFPLGILLFDLLKTKKNVIIFVVVAFVFSLVLEIIQYVFSLGLAEADDVVHNTLGAFLGYIACIYIPRIQITIKKR